MANVRCGTIWKLDKSSMPPSVFLTVDGTNTPVGGDLCDNQGTAKRAPQYKASSAAGPDSAALRTIGWICLEGAYEVDALNNDGQTARTGSKPAILQIGSNRARNADLTGKRKSFMPVLQGFEWVMTCSAAPTVGAQYGITRVGAGDYTVNVSNTTDAVVEVTGIYEPDWLANGSSARKYWVKAVLPGGYM